MSCLLITESEWTDENDNILYGSSEASLTQQLTEDRDLSAELTGPLTEVPLVCFIHCCFKRIFLYFIHCSCGKHKNSNVNNSITYLSFTVANLKVKILYFTLFI